MPSSAPGSLPPSKAWGIDSAIRTNGWFVAALALCILLDVLKHVALLAAGPVQPWPDSGGYWRLGSAVAAGDWGLLGSGEAYRTPVYPWFLAGCQLLFGRRALLGVTLMQHGLELAVSALACLTVLRMTRSRIAVIATYAWCAGLTARCLFANAVLTESPATFLATLFLWLVTTAPGGSLSAKRLLCAALCLGIAVLERPSLVALAPALLWAAARFAQVGSGWTLRGKRVALAGLIAFAVVLPWCVRNSLVWGRFTVSVFLGRELWTATFSPWPGAELPFPQSAAERELHERLADAPVDPRRNWSVAPALMHSGLNDAEADLLMQRVSVEAIRAAPWRASLRFLARCLTFWYVKDWELDESKYPAQDPWSDQASWSNAGARQRLRFWLRLTPERFFPPMWLWSAATFTAIAGLTSLRRWRSIGILLALMLLGLASLTAALEIPCYRYRCVLEPAMVVTVVTGAAAMLGKWGMADGG